MALSIAEHKVLEELKEKVRCFDQMILPSPRAARYPRGQNDIFNSGETLPTQLVNPALTEGFQAPPTYRSQQRAPIYQSKTHLVHPIQAQYHTESGLQQGHKPSHSSQAGLVRHQTPSTNQYQHSIPMSMQSRSTSAIRHRLPSTRSQASQTQTMTSFLPEAAPDATTSELDPSPVKVVSSESRLSENMFLVDGPKAYPNEFSEFISYKLEGSSSTMHDEKVHDSTKVEPFGFNLTAKEGEEKITLAKIKHLFKSYNVAIDIRAKAVAVYTVNRVIEQYRTGRKRKFGDDYKGFTQ